MRKDMSPWRGRTWWIGFLPLGRRRHCATLLLPFLPFATFLLDDDGPLLHPAPRSFRYWGPVSRCAPQHTIVVGLLQAAMLFPCPEVHLLHEVLLLLAPLLPLPCSPNCLERLSAHLLAPNCVSWVIRCPLVHDSCQSASVVCNVQVGHLRGTGPDELPIYPPELKR